MKNKGKSFLLSAVCNRHYSKLRSWAFVTKGQKRWQGLFKMKRERNIYFKELHY